MTDHTNLTASDRIVSLMELDARISDAEALLAQQRQVIHALAVLGGDTDEAEELMRQLEYAVARLRACRKLVMH